MKNIAIVVGTLVLLAIVAIGIYLSFFTLTDPEIEIIDQIGEEISITGVVFDNVQEVPADGNNFLMVDTNDGRRIVLYQEGGLVPAEQADEQCNQNMIVAQAAQSINAGDTVEVFGALNAEGNIEVCSNTDYNITVLERAQSEGENAVSETRQVSGEVVEFISDCAFDGNCAYVVETDAGEQVTVIWAEGSSPICQNDPFNGGDTNIEVGDTLDAFGRVIDETTISGCGDSSYYITKTS